MDLHLTIDPTSAFAVTAANDARSHFMAYLESVVDDGGSVALDQLSSGIASDLLTDIPVPDQDKAVLLASRVVYSQAAWAFLAYRLLQTATVLGYELSHESLPDEGPELTQALIARMRTCVSVTFDELLEHGYTVTSAELPEPD